jgi:hypothetical protein
MGEEVHTYAAAVLGLPILPTENMKVEWNRGDFALF